MAGPIGRSRTLRRRAASRPVRRPRPARLARIESGRLSPIRGRAHLIAPRLQLAILGGLLTRALEQAVELVGGNLLQRTEIGPRQRGLLEVAQQAGPVATLLGFEDAALTLEVALLVFEGAAFFVDGAAARQLVDRAAPVLVADLAGRLAVEVDAVRALRNRLQVRGAAGVAAEERGQRLLREDTRRAFMDVDLDAELERLRSAAEQRREALPQLRPCIALDRTGRWRSRRHGAGNRRFRRRRVGVRCVRNRRGRRDGVRRRSGGQRRRFVAPTGRF
ncbi:MAG: hypothetical protein ABIS28_15585 [Caldimonas sp.]